MIKTKVGTYTLGVMLMFLGMLLDSSGNAASQALHHLAFIMGGVFTGIAIMRR